MGIFGRGRTTTSVTRANKISDFSINTAEYGAPVMEILGTTRVNGNVIYYDDFTAHEHREEQRTRTGKGGGHSESVSVNIYYTYTVAVIMGLCEGPIYGIRKVWKGKETYNYPNSNIQMTLYSGTADQQPWPYVVGRHPERALAYKNLAYMCGVLDLGDSASMPNFNFEVVGKLPGHNDGTDVNPMDYILYVLSKIGQGNATFIGADNFRNYCAGAGLLISTPEDANRTQEARKIVNEIAELCGAYVFWSNDAYKIVPLADRPVSYWTPDKTIQYDLTPDDFIPQNGSCITWARKDSSELYNRFSVEFSNRANDYAKETVTYEDVDDIAEHGVRQAPTIQAGYIYTKARAVMVAENAARRNKIERNKYTFRLGWAFCRLEPGDLVRITDEASGIENLVVMIKEIQEDAAGFITVTAVSWFQNDYGAAVYDVHEVDRPYIDFNAPPGNTDTPIFFQPPADLTTNGLEVWIGAKGLSDNWGGCMVYVSDDNEHYRLVGQITNRARYGPLAADITADATSMEVDIEGTMLSGTQQDAERGNTLLWVDGECLSYETATLLQNGHYQLSGLIRGQYNTTAAAHTAGSVVVRCDEALLHVPFDKEDIGKQVWLKFCSYNIFGAGEQSLSDVTAYTYTLQPYYVPPVRSLTARNRYRQLKDGVNRYDIVVSWDPPELQSFLEGRVWYKTNALQSKDLSMASVKVSELGFNEVWIFGGSGKDTVTIPQAIVGDIYKIAVTTVDIWGVETSPDASPQVEIRVALKTELPNTPDGFGITFGDAAVVSWKEVINTDIAFYEVRLDTNPGLKSASLLARVTGLSTSVNLTSRTGRLYLYAYSANGKYSTPAILDYNKPAPPKPNQARLTAKLGGFSVVADSIPVGCNGLNIYIDSYKNNVKVHSVNNTYTHMCDAGGYDVTLAYTDIFGEGPRSDERSVVVKVVVDAALLEAEAVTKEKLSTALQNTIDTVGTNTQSINALITRMTTAEGAIAADGLAITQNAADISSLATRVTTAEGTITTQGTAISQNASDISSVAARVTTAEGTISTQGTAINQNASDISAVATRMTTAEGDIATNTTNIGINASGISAIVANLNDSTLARSYTAIQVMQDGIASKVSMGDVTSYFQQTHQGFLIEGSLIHISGNTVFDKGVITADMLQAGCITADAIYQAGYKVKNVTFITGTVSCPTTIDQWIRIPIPTDYTPDQCIVILTSVINTVVKNLEFDTCVQSDGYTYVMLRNVYYNPGQSAQYYVAIRYQTVGIK